MEKIVIVLLGIIALTTGMLVVNSTPREAPPLGNITPTAGLSAMGVNSSSTVGGVAVNCLASGSGRQMVVVSNSGNVGVWVSVTSTKLAGGNVGLLLTGSSSQVFSGDSVFDNGLYCATSGAGATTTVGFMTL